GTSVTRELSRFTTFRDIEVGGTRYGEKAQDMYAARFDLRKHSPAAKIRAKAGPEVWRGFFVFAFVRSPYARAYSLWKFLRRWKDGPHNALVSALSFEDFIASPEVREGAIEIAKPQSRWLADAEGRLMDGIDFVGRVERFDEDFAFILSTITRRPSAYKAEVRENASAEISEWETAMTPAAQTAVEEIYANDFSLFDFAKRESALAA
ncbi:MAG: sulfotransferase family 2 domain-containing protein, partial [Pseudomonadota bacterium]